MHRLTADRFERYDRDNPHIYAAFVRFTIQAIDAGRERVGAKAVMERIRWDTLVSGRGEFKIDNNFTAGYVRKFQADYALYASAFSVRQSVLSSLGRSARPCRDPVAAAPPRTGKVEPSAQGGLFP